MDHEAAITALSQLRKTADMLSGLRPMFLVKEEVHWRCQKRRQSTSTSLFSVCLLLAFPKEGFFGVQHHTGPKVNFGSVFTFIRKLTEKQQRENGEAEGN